MIGADSDILNSSDDLRSSSCTAITVVRRVGAQCLDGVEKKARGDARALIGELKDNLYYLDMVAEDGVELAAVVNKLSITEYKR